MMKNYLPFIVFCFTIFSSLESMAGSKEQDAILGTWLNAKQDGLIKIFKNRDQFDGVIVGSPNPDGTKRTDINNPDLKLRGRLLKGVVILHGFHFEGDNEWTGGQIYDPNNGETYRCELELIDPDKLSVHGYIGIPLFGRTEVWTRQP